MDESLRELLEEEFDGSFNALLDELLIEEFDELLAE